MAHVYCGTVYCGTVYCVLWYCGTVVLWYCVLWYCVTADTSRDVGTHNTALVGTLIQPTL